MEASLELVATGVTGPVWKMFSFEEDSPFESLLVESFTSSFFERSGLVHFLLNPPKPPPLPLPPKDNPLVLPFPLSLVAAGPPNALAAPLSEKADVSCLAPKTLVPPNGFEGDGC